MNINKNVIIYKQNACKYPEKNQIFRPSTFYPEYPFERTEISRQINDVYDSVREAYHMMKLDEEHWGKPEWNPLGEIVKPENTVLIKPNLVMESNHISKNGTDCLYTHPSVVAAVIDYVVIALKGCGRIIVGDAPMQECKWEMLIKQSGYMELIQWYKNHSVNIDLVDFRELTSEVKNGIYMQSVNSNVKGTVVDLQTESDFSQISSENLLKMRITNYNPNSLLKHHNKDKHEYYISDYLLQSDVIIDMPKPKTHRKAGITCAMKNLVGINIRKEFLPHHTVGSLEEGGDEYEKRNCILSFRSKILDKLNIASAEKRYVSAYIYRWGSRLLTLPLFFRKNKYSEGNWFGNNTICHTVTDLNKIVLYADKKGIMRNSPQRKIFVVADMIISGEKDGPTAPSPKKVGVIAMGDDLLCFDEVVSTIMGFDIEKIPTIKCARKAGGKYRISERECNTVICSNIPYLNNKTVNQIKYADSFKFKACPGWEGHIELE